MYSLLQKKWKSYRIPLYTSLHLFWSKKYEASKFNKGLACLVMWSHWDVYHDKVFMQFYLADYKDILVALWIPSWCHSSCLLLPLWTKWEKPSQSCWNVHVHPNPGMAAPHYTLSKIVFIFMLKVNYSYQLKIINNCTFMLINTVMILKT